MCLNVSLRPTSQGGATPLSIEHRVSPPGQDCQSSWDELDLGIEMKDWGHKH